jgi:hypothetical protein
MLRVAPDVTRTLALFVDKNEAADAYLIDGNSFIRAGWRAGPGEALPDADTLVAALDRMKSLPMTRATEHHH